MKVSNKSQTSLIGAIDIGSSEVIVVIGKFNDQKYEIIGVGNSVASGIKKGIVVDIDSTVNSIKMAIDEAELMADTKITNIWANVSGGHLNSFNSLGMVPIKNKEVSSDDINSMRCTQPTCDKLQFEKKTNTLLNCTNSVRFN